MPRFQLSALAVGLLVAVGFVQLDHGRAALQGAPSGESLRIEWRRTVHGWERIPVGVAAPVAASGVISAAHPLVLAALELLISLGALVTFASEAEISGRRQSVLDPARLKT